MTQDVWLTIDLDVNKVFLSLHDVDLEVEWVSTEHDSAFDAEAIVLWAMLNALKQGALNGFPA